MGDWWRQELLEDGFHWTAWSFPGGYKCSRSALGWQLNPGFFEEGLACRLIMAVQLNICWRLRWIPLWLQEPIIVLSGLVCSSTNYCPSTAGLPFPPIFDPPGPGCPSHQSLTLQDWAALPTNWSYWAELPFPPIIVSTGVTCSFHQSLALQRHAGR